MNTKSLLLGSAAVLAAMPGARAADAFIQPEPEPAEYVRICDAFGTGYFYIPGTETCLRIGGYVQYDIAGGEMFERATTDHRDGSDSEAWYKRTRVVLETFTAADTELGALKTYTQLRFNWANGGPTSTSLRHAYIDLAGFRIGKTESAYTTFIGSISNVMTDDVIPYGPYDTNLLSYTYTAGGFSGIVALEEGGSDSGLGDGSRFLAQNTHNYEIDSYMPHVVAGIRFKDDWGSIGVVGGYDSIHEKFTVKGRLDVNVTDGVSAFVMAGWGENDLEFDASARRAGRFNYYKPWGGEWAVWGGFAAEISEKAKLNMTVSYDQEKELGVVANVDYTLVKGLRIIPEVVYKDGGDLVDRDAFGGWLRIRRSF